jgi:hypothetical protein
LQTEIHGLVFISHEQTSNNLLCCIWHNIFVLNTI